MDDNFKVELDEAKLAVAPISESPTTPEMKAAHSKILKEKTHAFYKPLALLPAGIAAMAKVANSTFD